MSAEEGGRPPDGDEGATWTDPLDHAASDNSGGLAMKEGPPVGSGPVIDSLDREKQQHVNAMQIRVLYGLGAVFALTFVVLVPIGAFVSNGSAFALELARMIIPSVLGSGATMVGVLFVNERASNRRDR